MKRVVVAALSVGVVLAAGAHCGGTTGQDAPAPAAVTTMDAGDATMADPTDASADQSVYTNTFDVGIEFADQELPDVQAPPEAGSVGGPGGPPNCPPFIPVDNSGAPVPFGGPKMAINLVPSEYTGDGGIVFAPDGGTCATYPWLGSIATDQCVINAVPNQANWAYVLLPPCNWAVGAGTAVKGTGAGMPRYDLCMDMYECLMSTQCYLGETNLPYCFCGIPDTDPNYATDCSTAPHGECLAQILAAMEENDDARGINDAFSMSWQDISNMGPGFEGRFLEDLFSTVSGCKQQACAATDAGIAKKDAGGVCP